MSTTIPTTTDDLIADLERLTSDSELTDEQWISGFTAGDFRALLAERADLKQQLVAAGITADNCELFRKDAERLEWMLSEQCVMQSQNGCGSPVVYSLFWPQLGESQVDWHKSERDAIDAAMRQ